MCGIAGSLGPGAGPETVQAMLAVTEHRGPDDRGLFQSEEVVLGHNRLSIIDVSSAGRQPLANEDGTAWMVFNGEIYNYRELRRDLEPRHQFRTRTDSEVILHLYEEKGPGMVRELDGMFALAVWDGKGLFLARDPLGIKPLYYGRDTGGTLHFASEIKGLLEATSEVLEFPAGHWYRTGQGLRRYYEVPRPKQELSDPEKAVQELKERFEQAVAKRLLADVPVGVFLSGGLDSSLVSAVARRLTTAPVLHSFAVGCEGSPDLEASRQVAAHLGTAHHVLTYGSDEIIGSLREVIHRLESFDTALVRSAVPTFLVSRLAREWVKVVLSGEGADELFGGYHYLKDASVPDLGQELYAITRALHNTNLQRLDRLTMANSLEGRVPFLDLQVVDLGFHLADDLKIHGPGQIEKWILRKLAEEYLPGDIAWRRKEKFAIGTGTAEILVEYAEDQISDGEFESERYRIAETQKGSDPEHPRHDFKSKEELLYYRIFQERFPQPQLLGCLGWSRSL
ncbi:MAG: asparagine synthase B [Firmicutes bacterium]|nr:asparagine synthase B [Bacillota bacterium]